MELIAAALLGAVQGLTEFLPISSTGHLIIFERFFGLSDEIFGLSFDVALHMGTLLALLFYFRKNLKEILFSANERKLRLMLIAGTIPAVLAGLFFEKAIESVFRTPLVVGISLIVVGAIMALAEKTGHANTHTGVTFSKAFLIGLAQASALIPGVSRSGSTLSMGMFLGLSRESAARFAFLLAIPIMAGAGGKRLLESIPTLKSSMALPMVMGGLSSFVVGYIVIALLLDYVRNHSLYPFIVYRLFLGALLLLSIR